MTLESFRKVYHIFVFQSSIQVVGKVRSDARCGDGFPLDDGSPSECDGASEYPCCSNHGYCGPGAEHCSCAGCVDFRSGTGVCEYFLRKNSWNFSFRLKILKDCAFPKFGFGSLFVWFQTFLQKNLVS